MIHLTKNRIAAPFTIIIDCREKQPYTFTGIRTDAKHKGATLIVPTQFATLATADYTIAGHEDGIGIERKSLQDFVATVARNRDRFIAELERLADMQAAHIVVEASWDAILRRSLEFSRVPPKTFLRSVVSWSLKFPTVHWWMAGDRFMGERITYRLLEKFFNQSERK